MNPERKKSMLYRVFGLHGSGKTEYLYSELEKCVEKKKDAFLIVPEQNSLFAERTLIKRLGNPANMYIEVINFKRLCNRVFRESGGIAGETPDKTVKQLCMAQTVYELKDKLTEYKEMASDADFARKMLSSAEELKRYKITPEMLEEAVGKIDESGGEALKNKIKDVALLCRGYDAYISEKLGFPGDMLDKLYETLCSFDFFAGKTVFVDAFYGFTPQETAILERIIKTAENTYITFLCESEKQADKCFSRGVDAALSVKRICAKNGIEYKDLFFEDDLKHDKNSGLYRISREFSLGALSKKYDGKKYGDVQIIKCGDTYAEAKCAAKISSDLITSGVLPREIAVCARNIGEFEGIIDAEFENAHIPFSFDKRFDLTSTSAALFVLSAFEVYFSWSLQAVVSFLKTGLSGLDDESADELEMYMRTWNISGKKYFHEEWYMNPEGLTEDEPDKEQTDKINESKNILLSVLDGFCERLDAAKCAKDICDAVYMLTVDAANAKNGEIFDDGADGIYADLLFRVLDDFESAVGSEAVSPKRFYELFKFTLTSADMGKIPELIDQVRFSDVSLMRTDGVKYVIILDVCDGIFPAPPSGNALFADREKKLLKEAGIELSELDSECAYDEIFLAYTALCSARSGAYVLYREKDFSDNVIYPSVIVRILEKMLSVSSDDVERNKFNPDDVMNFALSDETLFECFLSLEEGSARQTLKEYFSSLPGYKDRIALAEKPDFTEAPLDESVLSTLYPDKITSSFSRLEKFNYCPFSYFCRYTLKINPEKKAEIGAIETGNIVHRALELILPVLAQKFAQNGKVTEEDISDEADKVLKGILNNIFTYSGSALTKRFEYTFAKLGKTIKAICGEMAEEMKVSSFVPVDFELDISERGSVKPVKTGTENGKILSITGKIDRVDMFSDKKTGKTWVRIADYKTGSKKFEIDDVQKGFNLQMLLYLYTLICASDGKYKDVYPAGVIYKMVMPAAQSTTLSKAAENEDPDGETVSQTDGIVVSDMDIIFAMDKENSGKFTPVKLTKTGETKGALPLEDLVKLLEDAVSKAGEIACGMSKGIKKADPYKDGKTRDACEYCDVRSICPSVKGKKNYVSDENDEG